MKKYRIITCTVFVTILGAFQLFGEESSAPAEEDKPEAAGPTEAIIRKLAAMMPEQTFKRQSATISDGKVAPKDATIYPVEILNADGSVLMKCFFFQDSGNWGVFDEHGNVFRETK